MYLNKWTQSVKLAKLPKMSYKKYIYSNIINTVLLYTSEKFHVLSFIFPLIKPTNISQCVLHGKLVLQRLMMLFIKRLLCII